MKITRVGITYGELRSAGYPSFCNKRHEITLVARLEIGETAEMVKVKLQDIAVREVKKAFGDNVDQTEMNLPF